MTPEPIIGRPLSMAMIDKAGVALAVADRAGNIVLANKAFARLVGMERSSLIGAGAGAFIQEEYLASLYRAVKNLVRVSMFDIEDDDPALQHQAEYPLSAGTKRWIDLSLTVDRLPAGKIVHFIIAATDISARKKLEDVHVLSANAFESALDGYEKRLAHMAYHDHLTGLPNRRFLEERVAQSIESARRAETRFAVLFIDLDRFKLVNDSLGHVAGDWLLVRVAERLKGLLRTSDIVARLGGDEFVVVLDNIPDNEVAGLVAASIVDHMTEPFVYNDLHKVSVGASVGISLYPDNSEDLNGLLQHADTALYQAKAAGKLTYRFYRQEMTVNARMRMSMEARIRRALEREHFVIHYQPQIDVKSGRIVSAEALVRWYDDELGYVPPAEFIPLAEDTGLIVPLGNWVLEKACRELARWTRDTKRELGLAVNISAKQFNLSQLNQKVRRVLDMTGVEPSRLVLELTESSVMAEGDPAIKLINDIKGSGVRMALDDFGTGYSSLSYLRRMPLDTLKIDKRFVDDVAFDSHDRAIISAVIQLGHVLNCAVVAEGVENREQLEFLQEQGCDLYQGYYYCRAVPPREFEKLLSFESPELTGTTARYRE